MNRIALVAVCALLLGAAIAQATEDTARAHLGYLGPVRRVVVQEQGDDTPLRVTREITFDRAGHLTAMTWYRYSYMDGTLSATSETRYDENGRAVAVEQRDPDGALMSRTEYRYQAGHTAEMRTVDADGNETRRLVYAYDGGGRPVRQETYVDGALAYVNETTYDAQGNRASSRRSDGAGTLITERTYTDGGPSFEELRYDEAGNVTRRSTARMDDAGRPVELVGFDPDGSEKNHTTYRYDDNGLLLGEVYSSDAADSTTTNDYAFDDRGNWVRREQTESFGGSAHSVLIELRDVTYFD